MRKTISLLTLMLLFVTTAMQAQSLETYGTPLITNGNQLSSNASDQDEGQHIEFVVDGNAGTFWHTDWHGVCTDQYHYLQVALEKEFSGDAILWLRRRQADNDHPTQFLVQGSTDGKSFTDITKVDLPYWGSGSIAQSGFFNIPEPVKYLRFNATNCAGGQGFRTFWHTAEFMVYGFDQTGKLSFKLNEVLMKYDAYLWGEKLNIGTDFGQYSDVESEATFMTGLKKINDILAGDIPMPSEEEVDALTKSVEEAYAAVLSSEVIYQLPANGYYRIYTALPYFTEEGGKKTFVPKAMYTDLEDTGWMGWWGTVDLNDVRFVWQLTKTEDNPYVIDMMNAGTNVRMSQWSGLNGWNAPIAFSEDGQIKVCFDWVGKEDGHDILNIRNSTMTREQNNYIVQNNHNNGTGTGSHLWVWQSRWGAGQFYASDKGCAEWYLEPVSDEEVQTLIEAYNQGKHHEEMLHEYKALLLNAQNALTLSQNQNATAHSEQPLITDVSQLSSIYSDSDEGQHLEFLIDDNPGSYWHTDWHGVHPGDPVHYLNVELKEEYQGTLTLWTARRLGGLNHHPTKMQVGASKDGETWVDIDQITAPFNGNNSSEYFTAFTLTEPYKYLRFGALNTKGASMGFSTFWCAGEIQLYPGVTAQKTQFEAMGELATTLAGLVEAGQAKEDDSITDADYDALKAAYDAFAPSIVDLSALTSAVTASRKEIKFIVTGDDPGFWEGETAGGQAQALIDNAQAYIHTGKYDQATVDDFVQKFKSLKADALAQANKVETGRWYRLRHMTDEDYAISGVPAGYPYLNGQYVAAGLRDGNVANITTSSDAREGQLLFFFDKKQFEDDADVALFRFLELPDGGYAVQNKATGLFLSRDSENGNVFLGFGPQKFDVQPIGFGQNTLQMEALDATTYKNAFLGANPSENCSQLLYGSDTSYGSVCTFMIEDAGAVDANYAAVAKKEVVKGKFYPMYYPESILPADGVVYEVAGTFIDEGKDYVAMNQLNGASEAGKPFVYILGTPDSYNAEAPETEVVDFTVSSNFNTTPGSKGGFIGVYSPKTVANGTVVFSENKTISVDSEMNNKVNSYTGYINFGGVLADAENAGSYALVTEITGEVNKEGIHTGTADDPYVLAYVEDLLAMRSKIKAGKLTYFVMKKDIDLSEVENWTPIGGSDPYAWVDFDGQGHVIKNLTSKSEEGYGYPSFFGVLCGNVRNVGFENVNIEGNGGCGVLGGYIGHNTFTYNGKQQTCYVENVWATGKLHVKASYGGGLAGNIGGPTVMRNCYVNMDVTGDIDLCGAIVGRVRGLLDMENVYAAGTCNKGGIIGGGQNDSTPSGSYKNVVVWNNTDKNFGTTAATDAVENISYYDGNNFAELQQTVADWGNIWYCGMAEGEYPTLLIAPVADLLDIVFLEEGGAKDISARHMKVEQVGNPYGYFNGIYNRRCVYIGDNNWSYDATSYFKVDFEENMSYRAALADGHTMECLVKPDIWGDLPNREVKPFSAQQSGGLGFLISKTAEGRGNEWTYLPNVTTTGESNWIWNNSGVVPQNDHYYHLVGIYDKEKQQTCIYVDGVLCKTVDAPGDFRFANAGCNWFGIGGDPASEVKANACFRGDIVLARIYDDPLTAEQVSALYAHLADGITTGIEKVAESKPAPAQIGIYTINGVRIEKTQKGIYIINGKKCLVK